jgi:acetyl esterase
LRSWQDDDDADSCAGQGHDLIPPGLPSALIINGEADVLRDEGEAYAAQLRAAGVPVTSVRYNGTIHDFVMLNALRDTHAAKAATAQGGEFLRATLWDE